MDVLELHTWNSTVERLEDPDRLVLDLDPGPEVPFARGGRAPRGSCADALAALRLGAFVKTTGGDGLHVVVPLVPARAWGECLAFSRGARGGDRRATIRARSPPRSRRRGRERKILVDYLRNNRTNTSVAAFSTRARPGAPVSVPLGWDELDAAAPARRGSRCGRVPRRLASLGDDPWAGYAAAARPLDDARLAAVGAAGSRAGARP